MSGLRQRVLFVVLPLGVATEEVLSVTALRRLVGNRSGRGRRVTGRPLYSPSRAMAK
jgi:hypothetical protein